MPLQRFYGAVECDELVAVGRDVGPPAEFAALQTLFPDDVAGRALRLAAPPAPAFRGGEAPGCECEVDGMKTVRTARIGEARCSSSMPAARW